MTDSLTLDSHTLTTAMKARGSEYQALGEQLQDLKSAFQVITDLEDFQGKGADAIKGFYQAHINVIDKLTDFITEHVEFLNDNVGKIAADFDLGEHTVVHVPFLQQELTNASELARDMVEGQQDSLKSIFSSIDDILSLKVFSSASFEEEMNLADQEREDTVDAVKRLDEEWRVQYDFSLVDQNLAEGLIIALLEATRQDNNVQPINFNAQSYQSHPIHEAIEDSQEVKASIREYKEALEQSRAEAARLEELENRKWYEKVWDTASVFVGEVSGVYDAERAATGVDPVTGQQLSDAERVQAATLAAAGYIPVVGWAGKAVKGGKAIYKTTKAAEGTSHVLDIYQNAKAFDILKKTEYGLYGIASYNGVSEYITGKDMFGNPLDDEARENSLDMAMSMLPLGGRQVSRTLSVKDEAGSVVRQTDNVQDLKQAQSKVVNDVESGQIPLITNKQKGNYGEMKMDIHFESQGYKRINKDRVTSLDDKIIKGIDGVYENSSPPPKYIIGEAKYGSAQLGKTKSGLQMSDKWVESSERLVKAVGKNKADEIMMEKLINPSNIEKKLVRIEQNGSVTEKGIEK